MQKYKCIPADGANVMAKIFPLWVHGDSAVVVVKVLTKMLKLKNPFFVKKKLCWLHRKYIIFEYLLSTREVGHLFRKLPFFGETQQK